ncbi:MAG TPA: ATP-binding protein, partial [Amaricoccus sp.]|nr:ATP-binding protein [Amaricoccus sp.]
GAAFDGVTPESLRLDQPLGARWMTLLFLAATAAICLPRQFQVTVVENSDESHLATASWLFPLYMLLMSFFVLPIAAVGTATLSDSANPDLFMLLLPLHFGRESLATLIFIGGLSAATSMVIVTTIALSTMVSNHIVAPLALSMLAARGVERSGDVKRMLLVTRRVAMIVILGLGYAYLLAAGRSDALAATGLIAFCGVAQFLPALIAGIFWRNATRAGAIAGLVTGFVLWCYTLYLPSFGGAFLLSAETLADGPFGIAALRPQALFGSVAADALVHATAWSLGVNAAVLVMVSLCTRLTPMERLQGMLFVGAFRSDSLDALGIVHRSAPRAELYVLAQRILGTDPAAALFQDAARGQGRLTDLPEPTPAFISRLEREFAGSIGAASAHAMLGRIAEGESISLDALIEIADENARLMRTTEALRLTSAEAEESAARLRGANERLLALDAQKDEFLSHVSHELRTPMTSVRSFAEILRDTPDLPAAERARFAGVIQSESLRLTRLIDQIHELSFPEERDGSLPPAPVDPEAVLDSAVEIALAPFAGRRVRLTRPRRGAGAQVAIEPGRLSQVYINLIANAVLHSDVEEVQIAVSSFRPGPGSYVVEIADNGPGIPEGLRERIFEPFFRGTRAGSAGLGLAISARIIESFGGGIEAVPSPQGGACFRLRLPTCAGA